MSGDEIDSEERTQVQNDYVRAGPALVPEGQNDYVRAGPALVSEGQFSSCRCMTRHITVHEL